MGTDRGLNLSTPTTAGPQHSPEHAHKLLLHSGYHLVHHHEASLPHLPHGIGTLVCVLVVVHVAAIGYLAYLFSRPLPARPRRRRGADLKPLKCENDWVGGGSGGRAVPGRTHNV